MKTPPKYEKMIKEHMLTEELIGSCIYSCNKRAKNARDKQGEYMQRRLECHFYYFDKYHNESNYKKKKLDYYSKKEFLLRFFEPKIIHFIEDTGEHFLLYEVGGFSFHSPLKGNKLRKMKKEYKIQSIKTLNTTGKEINELLSCQFVDKVIALLKSGDYTILKDV